MKFQILLFGENKKSTMNLSFTKLTHRVVKVKCDYTNSFMTEA